MKPMKDMTRPAMTEIHKETVTAISGDILVLIMAWTLNRGLMVLLAVLALLSRLPSVSGVYQGSRDQQPNGSSGKRRSGFGVPSGKQNSGLGELHEEQSQVPVKPSTSESSNQQFPGETMNDPAQDWFPELFWDQSRSKYTADQSSVVTTRASGKQTLGSMETIEYAPDHSDCAPTPIGPPPCVGFGGPYQSPINIDSCNDELTVDRSPLRFRNLHMAPASMVLRNAGNRFMGMVKWGSNPPATISGGQLPGTFVYRGLDMHWGANSSYGSPHSINGERYAAELHIVLLNTKYETIQEALLNVDGVATIAIFLDEKAASNLRGIAPLAESLFQIKEAYSTSEVASPPNLKQLLPLRLDRYVMYSGSPTVGSLCYGSVTWIIMLNPVRILEKELELARLLRSPNGGRLCQSTIRPQQYVSGRKLYTRQQFLRCLFRAT